MSLSKLREMVKDREAWRATVNEVAKSETWLRDLGTEQQEVPKLLSSTAHPESYTRIKKNQEESRRDVKKDLSPFLRWSLQEQYMEVFY